MDTMMVNGRILLMELLAMRRFSVQLANGEHESALEIMRRSAGSHQATLVVEVCSDPFTRMTKRQEIGFVEQARDAISALVKYYDLSGKRDPRQIIRSMVYVYDD